LKKGNKTILVVGNQIGQTPGILSKLFESLNEIPVRMVSYGGSKHNVSLLVGSEHKNATLQKLNSGLFGL